MKKNLIVAIVALIVSIVIVAPTAVLAQSGSSIVDDKEWVKRSQECNTKIGKSCDQYAGGTAWMNATACVNVVNYCGEPIVAAKQAGNTSDGFKAYKRRYDRLIRGLWKSVKALEEAVAANSAEIAELKADLQRNWDDHNVIRAEAKAQAEAQAVKDGEQDEEIAELKGRMDDAEYGIEANRVAIARVGKKVRFDLGAALVLSSDIMGAAGLIGLNFAITDIVRAKIHAGIGVSFDGEAVLVGQAGPEFLLGEKKNLAVGVSALFLKEQMNDKGDTFIGAGPEFSFYFAEHGFLSLLGGLGTSTRLIDAPIPGYPMRTEREWDLAWAVMFQIGGTF